MPTYNAGTLADDLRIEPSAVRVLLRKSGLKKPGAVWGWDTKTEYESVLKTLKGLGTKEPKTKEPKTEAKPASKGKAKAA